MGILLNRLPTMADVKLAYFDLRVKGEAARLLLAYGGLKYEDDRVTLPWDDASVWAGLKKTLPWGQLPCLTWNGLKICQSMTICRFLAREMNIAGRNSLEMAQVDEIVDVVQDAIDANYKAWNAKDRKVQLVLLTGTTFPTVLTQLEKRLTERGGQFFVGNSFTWADLHVFLLCSEDFTSPTVLQTYPKLHNLVSRVGELPNIKHWMETRPAHKSPQKDSMIFFKNAYQILAENLA